jgi:catechol 2,3-dioxygenase-like lactoylglutathione lyase family enzyme
VIDHVSVAVSDIAAAVRFYETLLATIGMVKLEVRPATVGFGKTYPEFWVNLRAGEVQTSSGAHVCFRARTSAMVDAFHAAALAAGGSSDGSPGLRPHHGEGYYAAFIRDLNGNRLEAVTFVGSNQL